MTVARLLALLTSTVLALGGSATAADPATQLYPIDLRVDSGGEGSWFPENVFHLSWDRPPIADEGFPISAVGFRVRDAAGALVASPVRMSSDHTAIQGIRVPPVPGVYTAEVWLEGPGGASGPSRSVALRFDDAAPGIARPSGPPGWISADTPARIAVAAAGPQPISGIRGYAVAVDRRGEPAPCAVPGRCSIAETDLMGGPAGGTISLGALPEGDNVVGVVAVSGAGVSSTDVATTVVRVDATRPQTTLAGAPQGWANGPVRLVARSTDAQSGMRAGGSAGAYTAIAVDGGPPRLEPGDSAAATVAGEGTHLVTFHARDAAGNLGDRSAGTAVAIDESPPRVAFARVQDPGDPERIEAKIVDGLSGPDPGRGSIAVRAAGTTRHWTPLPTAATPGRLVARWDSESHPAGAYEFRASGYDLAGNGAVSNQRGNGVKMVLVNPLKVPVRLQAGLAASAVRTLPYGRRISYGGRLTTRSGVALSSQPIEIVETLDPGAVPSRRSTTVLTDADGRFGARLRPGPSRSVVASFAGNGTLGRVSGGESRLRVRAGLRLRVSSRLARIGGARVVFSGRLGALGAPLPAEGRAVELQFRLPGRPWAEFRTVETDSRGRFRYPYAFSDDDSRGVRFLFRAYAPAQGDWPYEPAGSKPAAVRGR